MPRQVRTEFPGAVYHAMARGDRRKDINPHFPALRSAPPAEIVTAMNIAKTINENGGRAGRARDPERDESLRAMYSDKQTLEELRTGLIESAGIECSVHSCKLHVQIVRRWE